MPMPPEFHPTVVIAGIAAILLVAMLIGLKAWLRGPERLPYRPVASLLTPAEGGFYRALLQSIGESPIVILAKVRLRDLVEIPPGVDAPQRHHGRVMAKHVDFVLCELQTLRPLLVIELDDRSHQRRDRMDRDAFVDCVMQTIGLPIWHVPCTGRYVVGELRAGIALRIKSAR